MPNHSNQEIFDAESEQGFLTWNDKKSFDEVLKTTANNYEEYGGVHRSTATGDRTFLNTEDNISVRSEYNRGDYNYFRTHETVPRRQEDILRWCSQAYDKIYIVHHTVDLMGDFTCQGIRIVHPNPKIQKFHRRWAEHVDFEGVSERISNYLYRLANVPIKSTYGTVPAKVEQRWRTSGERQEKIEQRKISKRKIPLKYNFLNPLSLEVIGGELSAFIGKPMFALKLSHTLNSKLTRIFQGKNTNSEVAKLTSALSAEFRNAVMAGKRTMLLDPDRLEVLYYKKDDWKVWANPMTYAILDQLVMLEKMHLADMSSLDGAISNIRLWTLGNFENHVLPTRAAVNKLRNILSSLGTGTLDLVYGPELTFTESQTTVHQFLGPEKYQQVVSEIYEGLGLPMAITGTRGGSGLANNAISVKTLINRLEYGRKILVRFWNEQFRIIQKAMGWRFPAKVVFDHMVLSDDAAEKDLWISLYDRDLISVETLVEKFGAIPEIEELRMRKENKRRSSGLLPDKASPYHNPQMDHDLKKIILQRGGVAPSELGVELLDKKEGELSPNEQMMKLKSERPEQKVNNPVNDNGRPKNARDKGKRKEKQLNPTKSEFVSRFLWANEAQRDIGAIVAPGVLNKYKKKSVRALSRNQQEQFEHLKLRVLCNLEPYCEVTQEVVYNVLQSKPKADADIIAMCKTLAHVFQQHNDRLPSIEEVRQIQASAFSMKYEE